MNLSAVNDTEILNEYVRRFTIPAGQRISSAKAAADHFRAYFATAAKREQFVVCFLNNQHQVLCTECLFEGTINSSAVYPRTVIERVLELGCGSLMFCHNHPSGNTDPSNSDRAVTRKLETALNAIDVDVLDHIILGGSEFYSFADHHLL